MSRRKLPSYQHEQVRIYKRGTPVGQLIETVLKPGETNDAKQRLSLQIEFVVFNLQGCCLGWRY